MIIQSQNCLKFENNLLFTTRQGRFLTETTNFTEAVALVASNIATALYA